MQDLRLVVKRTNDKDSIVECCIGDAASNDRRVIGAYIRMNRQMTAFAIRKGSDAVASESK